MIEWKSAFRLLEWSLVVDRLDELLVLTTILDAGSLAAAARRLRRSPPAMTRSLAALDWPELLARLSAEAQSDAGRAACLALGPADDADEARRQEARSEA